ncbi:MAG: preprotein translocase subunit SecG, partial [Devosiaceae bacterium]|nr:preprotein translocase subunit SecG [Devosiaceae bacterium MH13]
MDTLETVLIVVHLLVVIALVAVVLLQRSEGGALGIGGGGGGGQFMSSRGQANVLTRATAFLALGFFATSIALTILAQTAAGPSSILDQIPDAQPSAPGTTLLEQIGGEVAPEEGEVEVPTAPAEP